MTVSRTVDSFDLYVRRSPSEQWMLRSRHDTADDLLAAVTEVDPFLCLKFHKTTRQVVGFSEPARPSEARRHREAVADAMTVRAQAMKLYKSSANGTELASIPEEGVIK